ncbi:MAG: DivIVA domain-containing protein [Amoebophilaceae bacterium]|jgi:cell division initiation protein|nr:DivIVA domain-containing protein [Amoebophilaceae bacterium]
MQRITPIEIRQKSFEKSFRGYQPDEVGAFLYALSCAWEELIAHLDMVKSKLEESNKEVTRLQSVENALLRTVKDAEITAHGLIEQAKKGAQLCARETKIETERLVYEAQERVRAIEEESQRKHQRLEEKMARELEKTNKVVQEAETYRDTLLQKLQHLAEDILTKIRSIDGNRKLHVGNEEAPN